MNPNKIKRPIMPIMLGVALSVMLLLSPFLSFALERHYFPFNYDIIQKSYLLDSIGNWDNSEIKNSDYVEFINISPIFQPDRAPRPWLNLNRIPDNSPASAGLGGYVRIPTNGDNYLSGNFKYSAYFMLWSLPSDHGQTVTRNFLNGNRAWYCVVEGRGITPIYIAYDDTVRALFTKKFGVVDNSDTGFSIVQGVWDTYPEVDSHGPWYSNNYRYHAGGGTGANKVKWKASLVSGPGDYKVFVWYQASPKNASNASFTVKHADGSTTVRVDQQESPYDPDTGSGDPYNEGWQISIGTYYFADDGTEGVTLSDNANGDVIADAVKFVVADGVINNVDELIAKDESSGAVLRVKRSTNQTVFWYYAKFYVQRNTTGGATEELLVSERDPQTGEWSNYYDSKSIDEVPEDPDWKLPQQQRDPQDWRISIGASGYGNTYYFDGIIDSVDIYLDLP
ncbi:MAG: hypothetical protein HY999_04140 [Nitrospinae bacterium]|nr:hypothetical protein [Nitrospinota bacterium]